jgi:hypothetical protein
METASRDQKTFDESDLISEKSVRIQRLQELICDLLRKNQDLRMQSTSANVRTDDPSNMNSSSASRSEMPIRSRSEIALDK